MGRRSLTVLALAARTGGEPDDVLLALWDAGVDYVNGPNSVVRTSDIARAERALELASPKARSQVEYWTRLLGIDRLELKSTLATMGVTLSPNARRLPKGALAKLERRFVGPVNSSVGQLLVSNSVAAPPQTRPFDWQIVGHRKEMHLLTAEQVEAIHFAIAADFSGSPDPISPAGVRYRDLLESAITRPMSGLGEERKYPTVEMAGAALMHSLIHNHPFHNGNKRTALVSLLCFLDRNGYMLRSNEKDVFQWTVRVAQHRVAPLDIRGDRHDIEVLEMAKWIRANSRSIDRGERVITFAVLRRRLRELGCDVQSVPNRGGRVVVSRVVTARSRSWGRIRQSEEPRKFNLSYGGEGRQVSRTALKELRQQMQFSEEYGYDSERFYGSSEETADAFIAIYQKTLSRLARL